MKKLFKMRVLFLILLVFALGTLISSNVEKSGQYLKTSTGANNDTINRALANDTSVTFRNPGFENLLCEANFGSGLFVAWKIKYPQFEFYRLRYVAADSTIYTEVKGLFGYYPVQIEKMTGSTIYGGYEVPLRSGTCIFGINGY